MIILIVSTIYIFVHLINKKKSVLIDISIRPEMFRLPSYSDVTEGFQQSHLYSLLQHCTVHSVLSRINSGYVLSSLSLWETCFVDFSS
jgi:hypothetical protein